MSYQITAQDNITTTYDNTTNVWENFNIKSGVYLFGKLSNNLNLVFCQQVK